MNIIKLDVEVKANGIKDTIPLRNKVAQAFHPNIPIGDIAAGSERLWGMSGTNMQAIYLQSALIVSFVKSANKVFLFDNNQSQEATQLSIEVLILSSGRDVNLALNEVIQYMREVFQQEKCTLNVLKNNAVYLYPFNCADNDAYSATYKIKAYYAETKPIINISGIDKISIFIAAMGLLGSLIIAFYSNLSNEVKGYAINVLHTSSLFIGIHVLRAVAEYCKNKNNKNKLEITIVDLSNIAEPNYRFTNMVFLDPSTLHNPKIGGNS